LNWKDEEFIGKRKGVKKWTACFLLLLSEPFEKRELSGTLCFRGTHINMYARLFVRDLPDSVKGFYAFFTEVRFP